MEKLIGQWQIKGRRRPLLTKSFLISCSFWGNLANLFVGAPSYGESWICPCRHFLDTSPSVKIDLDLYILLTEKGSFVLFSGNFLIMAVMLQKPNRQTNYGVYVMALAVFDQTVLFSTLHHFIQGRLNAWTLPPCKYVIFMGGLYNVLYYPMNVIRHQRVF